MAEAHSSTDAAACSTEFFSAHIESLREALSTVDMNDDEARVEVDIEASKVHWSELTSAYVTGEDLATSTSTSEAARMNKVETMEEWNERVAEDNVVVFRSLQAMYPSGFFVDENVVGPDYVQKLPWWLVDEDGKPPLVQVKLSSEKPFAEGGQAQLFDAHVVFQDGERREGLVMKVFKEGTSLRHLQSSLPPSMLSNKHTQDNGWFRVVGCNIIVGARLLKSVGRFAFLMFKACGDLRGLIDEIMLQKFSNQAAPSAPFRDDVALRCISLIAMGMQSLHAKGIVHRDLKAANVLIGSFSGLSFSDPEPLDPYDFACHVADFECSIGVVGTGFWRAPEILLAMKNKNYRENPEIFSKQADVYSFGMTCYEILTGCIPFEELCKNDYDGVIGGARPILPLQTPPWLVDLVKRCWDEEPYRRPTFDEILLVLGDEDRYLFGRR